MSINTLAHVFTPHGNIVYTANDFRQTVRIAVAGTIALSISTFYDVQYGVLFVVYPLMLMSLVPVFNRHVARQFVFSAAVNCRPTRSRRESRARHWGSSDGVCSERSSPSMLCSACFCRAESSTFWNVSRDPVRNSTRFLYCCCAHQACQSAEMGN